jgi:hypothetical protein
MLAEDILLSVFLNNDIDFLFSRTDGAIIPNIKLPKRLKQYKYIFYKFVIDISTNDERLYTALIDLAFGHIISTTILVEDYHYDSDTIKDCEVFLDTSFVLRVIGTDGKKMMEVYRDFITNLYLAKANLKIFKHTQDEIYELLEGAAEWINSPDYDFNKASRMLKHFKEEGFSRSQVEYYIPKVQTVIDEFEIEIISKPEYHYSSQVLINEIKLTGILERKLTDSNPSLYLDRYKTRTQRDVDSISSIYIFRKGNSPRYLREAKYCFVTTNSLLSLVIFIYKKEMAIPKNELPACLTDTFIGSILWLKQPKTAKHDIKNKFLADCYLAISPDEHLEKLLLGEAEKLKNHHEITEEDFILLSTTYLTKDLLNEETLNDPEHFRPDTTFSILEDIKEKIKSEEFKAHNKTKEELDKFVEENASLRTQNIELKKILLDEAQKKAKASNWIYGLLIFVPLIIPIPFVFILTPWISVVPIGSAIFNAWLSFFKRFSFKGNYRYVKQRELNKLFEKHKIIDKI